MRLLSLLCIFKLLIPALAVAIEAHPPIPDCSAQLELESAVVGRWRGADSSIVPLRVHEALLRLPPAKTFELLFLHTPALESDMEALYQILDTHPNVRLKLQRTNFGGHDWNYGPPSHDSEFAVLSARPADLIAFVPLVSRFDRVVLINPDAPVEMRLKEITPLLPHHADYVEFEPLVDSPLAGVLGRIGQLFTLNSEREITYRVKFAAEDFTFEEANQLPQILENYGGIFKNYAYLGSVDSRTGVARSGAFFAEYSHLKIRSVIAILGLSPHVRVLEMSVD